LTDIFYSEKVFDKWQAGVTFDSGVAPKWTIWTMEFYYPFGNDDKQPMLWVAGNGNIWTGSVSRKVQSPLPMLLLFSAWHHKVKSQFANIDTGSGGLFGTRKRLARPDIRHRLVLLSLGMWEFLGEKLPPNFKVSAFSQKHS
jgi:hypothetical protein